MVKQRADSYQINGNHYSKYGEYQPWTVLQHWLTPEEYRGWQKGNAIVYLARERDKNGNEDLQKAAHHLQKLIEVETAKETPKLFKSPLADAASFPQLDSFERAYAVSVDAPKRVVGRLRRTDDVASEAWDSIPIYSGELNDIPIIREDKCSTQTKSS